MADMMPSSTVIRMTTENYRAHLYPPLRLSNTPNQAAFLNLPQHLRDRIYGIALTYDQRISVHKRSDTVYHSKHEPCGEHTEIKTCRFIPPLLRTCRQIEIEASPIFFANNEFVTFIRDGDFDPLFDWFAEVPVGYISHVSRITLRIEPVSVVDLLELASRSMGYRMKVDAGAFDRHSRAAGLARSKFFYECPAPYGAVTEVADLSWNVAHNIQQNWVDGFKKQLVNVDMDKAMADSLASMSLEMPKNVMGSGLWSFGPE